MGVNTIAIIAYVLAIATISLPGRVAFVVGTELVIALLALALPGEVLAPPSNQHLRRSKRTQARLRSLDTVSTTCVCDGDNEDGDSCWDMSEDEVDPEKAILPLMSMGDDILGDLSAPTPMERFLRRDPIDIQQEWRFVKGKIYDGRSLMDWLDNDAELSTHA